VSNNAKKTSGPFDVKTVESLVALMAENDLSEIYLRDGNQHLRLRRGAAATPVVVPTPMPLVATPAPAAPKPAAEPAPTPSIVSKKNLIEIKSDTVGVFYTQPKPGDPPYVKVGDRVTPTTVVGVVMVMKTHNEIQAQCAGVIREILIKNDQAVDFNQVLFLVDPEA
jgi:acetyl-CoA carboxylase biotin carboxyl carrier protein